MATERSGDAGASAKKAPAKKKAAARKPAVRKKPSAAVGKKPSAAVGKKITQTAVIKDPGALRSTVWLEIGPIWMERHPTRPEELIIKEISTRRTQQQ